MYKYIFPILFFLLPLTTQAATELYLDPAEKTVGPGMSFEADVKINIEEDCINTVEAALEFDSGYLQLVEFLTGDSLLSIWLQRPDRTQLSDINREGVIRFSGGIPGGYCGQIPGDPGDSSIVARLVFKVPSMIVSGGDKTELNIGFIEPTSVLINDGLGTAAQVSTRGAKLDFQERLLESDNSWRERIQADDIPPEPFVVELRQREDMFNGDYFLIFDTQDKQTGIDHFEVLELKPGQQYGQTPELSWWDKLTGREYEVPVWKKAAINYLLEDQTLQSNIRVKAIDKAGNERLVEFVPPQEVVEQIEQVAQTEQNMVLYIAGISLGAVVLLMLMVFYLFRRRHKKQQENYEDDLSFTEDE